MIDAWNEAQQSHIRSMSWLAQVFPQKLRAVIEGELWRGHAKKDGTPFVSFYDAATTPIPYGLGLDCPGDHLSYREAIRYCEVMPANKRVAELLRSEEAKGNPLGKQGGTGANQHTKEEESKGSDRTSARKRGENAAYLTARIERDAPEIAERLAQGQFRSVRQAAIEAGIVKVPTDFEKAQKAALRLPVEKRLLLLNWLAGQCEEVASR